MISDIHLNRSVNHSIQPNDSNSPKYMTFYSPKMCVTKGTNTSLLSQSIDIVFGKTRCLSNDADSSHLLVIPGTKLSKAPFEGSGMTWSRRMTLIFTTLIEVKPISELEAPRGTSMFRPYQTFPPGYGFTIKPSSSFTNASRSHVETRLLPLLTTPSAFYKVSPPLILAMTASKTSIDKMGGRRSLHLEACNKKAFQLSSKERVENGHGIEKEVNERSGSKRDVNKEWNNKRFVGFENFPFEIRALVFHECDVATLEVLIPALRPTKEAYLQAVQFLYKHHWFSIAAQEKWSLYGVAKGWRPQVQKLAMRLE
jgi:hypothetical protein